MAGGKGLLTDVPKCLLPLWRRVCTKALREFVGAVESRNDALAVQPLFSLLSAANTVLSSAHKPRRGGRGRSGKHFNARWRSAVEKSLAQALADGAEQVPAVPLPCLEPDAQDTGPLPPLPLVTSEDVDTEAAGRAAARHMRNGRPGRAAAALTQLPARDATDPRVQRHIAHLFPAGPAPGEIPPVPGNAMRVAFDRTAEGREAFVKLIRNRLATGGSPDLYGWTGEMVQALVEDVESIDLVMRVIELMRNGEIPEIVTPFLTAGKLRCGPKKLSLRPIGVPVTLYRLAAITAADEGVEGALPDLVPVQLGVGVRGGPEAVAQMTAALLMAPASERDGEDSPWAGEQLAGFCLDVENAFGCADRVRLLRALFANQRCRKVWLFAHWAYSSPAYMLAPGRDGVACAVLSQQGGRQGCPLFPLLFCMLVNPVLKRAKEGTSALVFAILDDITLIALARELPGMVVLIRQWLWTECGLRLSVPKSVGLWFGEGPAPDVLTAFCEEHGFQVCTTACKNLGSPLGKEGEAQQQILRDTLDRQLVLFRSILSPHVSVQMGLVLLRMCAVPQLMYTCRTVAPQHLTDTVREFDAQTWQTLQQKLDIAEEELSQQTVRERVRALVYTSARRGGLGMTSQEEVSPFAWLGAFAQAAHLLGTSHLAARVEANPVVAEAVAVVAERLQVLGPREEHPHAVQAALPPVLSVRTALQHFSAPLPPRGRPRARTLPLFPAGPARPSVDPEHQVPSHPAERLQAVLSKAVRGKRASTFAAALPPLHRVAVEHASEKHASAWMFALPTHPDKLLTNVEATTTARMRLRLPACLPAPPSPSQCSSCHGSILPFDASHHHLGCPQLFASGMLTRRHDLIKHALARVLRRCGALVSLERYVGSGQERIDLEIVAFSASRSEKLWLDVSVVHPLTVGRSRDAHLHTVSSVLAEREREKEAHYSSLAGDAGALLVPFVVSTFGALGHMARSFLDRLPAFAAAAPEDVLSGAQLREHALDAVSVALQRGNAACCVEGANLSRAAEASRPRPEVPRLGGSVALREALALPVQPDGAPPARLGGEELSDE